jgi:5'-methylthioadenosine phosphorylase
MNKIGIIGGSALYNIDDLVIDKTVEVKTPFGHPSDLFVTGKLSGREVVFLPRHGRKHHLLPTEVNYRANIYAFKTLGVDRILSVSAVGSLKEEIKPLDVLLVDQFIDRTNQSRQMTFFGNGLVAHVSFGEPVCKELREAIYKANKHLDINLHNGGTYLNMEGPAFSTKAESFLYKSWGVSVIGMTNIAEARLAREAGICYTTMAMVTDYDCWHEGAGVETVSVDMIMQNLMKNNEVAKQMLKNTIKELSASPGCSCRDSLKAAIVTPLDSVPEKTLKDLAPILKGTA